MCGRSSLTKTEKELEERFQASFYTDDLERYNPLPNFNIAPSQNVILLLNTKPKLFQMAKWGLVPSWSKVDLYGSKMINARKESLLEKKSFRSLVAQRRCIIPLDGYYEWKKMTNSQSIPYRITMHDQSIFSVAGLWDEWKNKNGDFHRTFTLITQAAPAYLSDIHHRIPGILLPEQEKNWLNNDIPTQELLDLIQPLEEGKLNAYTVSKRINNVRNNDATLIEEVVYNDPGEQLRMF